MKNLNPKYSSLPPFMRAALIGMVIAGPKPPTPAVEDAPQPPHDERDALEELKSKMSNLHTEMEEIRANVDKEQRRITEDEVKRLEALSDEFDELDDEVRVRERVLAQKEKLTTTPKRRTQPGEPVPQTEANGRQRVEVGERIGASKGTWGFRSLGEFANIVASGEGRKDPRITNAAATYGGETTLADGGFAVPPDFRDTIVKKIAGEDSLLARTDQQYTSSDRMTVPLDNTTPWQESGGIQVYWDNEGAQMTPSKPAVEQMECKAHRMTCLVPVTQELLDDALSLSRYLPGKVADKYTSKINKAIIQGDGVAKPKGLLLSASKIAVPAEAAQTDFVNYKNVANMWSRLYAPLRNDAVWLINQDLEPALMEMTVPGTQPSYPAYMPPGGLSERPYGMLMGRPCIAQEFCKTAGVEGDIILTNLSSYLTVQKAGGLRSDVSIHLYFDQNIVAFRFVMRLGGQSWWSAPATRAEGSNTLSNIVTRASV